jgi:hypothetical protein
MRIAKTRPCPFCGTTDNFVECLDFGTFAVVCNGCGARGPEADGDDCDPDSDRARGRRGAVRAWNGRKRSAHAAPDAPPATTDGLSQARSGATEPNPPSPVNEGAKP